MTFRSITIGLALAAGLCVLGQVAGVDLMGNDYVPPGVFGLLVFVAGPAATGYSTSWRTCLGWRQSAMIPVARSAGPAWDARPESQRNCFMYKRLRVCPISDSPPWFRSVPRQAFICGDRFRPCRGRPG